MARAGSLHNNGGSNAEIAAIRVSFYEYSAYILPHL